MKVMKSSMDSLSQETDSLFSTYKENDPEKAREQMVALEQRYHNMLKAFSFLRQDTLGVQEQYIDHQLAISKWLERVQYMIAGLLLIVVAMIVSYGHKLSKRMVDSVKERENLLEQVHQAEDKYRSIVDNAVEGIFQSTPEGRYITANMAMAKMYGYGSPRELMSSVTDIDNQLYVNPRVRDEILDCLQNGEAVTGTEVEVYRKDGRTIWVSLNVHAVYAESGSILCFEGTVEDITERRWAEHRRNLQYSTAGVLNDAATVAEARPKILQTICEILGVGHVVGLGCRCPPANF